MRKYDFLPNVEGGVIKSERGRNAGQGSPPHPRNVGNPAEGGAIGRVGDGGQSARRLVGIGSLRSVFDGAGERKACGGVGERGGRRWAVSDHGGHLIAGRVCCLNDRAAWVSDGVAVAIQVVGVGNNERAGQTGHGGGFREELVGGGVGVSVSTHAGRGGEQTTDRVVGFGDIRGGWITEIAERLAAAVVVGAAHGGSIPCGVNGPYSAWCGGVMVNRHSIYG